MKSNIFGAIESPFDFSRPFSGLFAPKSVPNNFSEKIASDTMEYEI